MAEKTEEKNIDDDDINLSHMPKMIEVYRPFLRRYLRCGHLLPFMPFLRAHCPKIVRLERQENQEEAVDVFLNCLEDADEDHAPYATFRDALGQADLNHIASVLAGKDVAENHEEHCKLIQEIFAPTLIKQIDVQLIIPALRPHQLLLPRDEETIRNVAREHSNQDAVMLLLDFIPRRQKDWYKKFMSEMLKCYPMLVDEVDPFFAEKMKKCNIEPDSDEGGTIEEPTLTVKGEAHKSVGYQGGDMNIFVEKGSNESMEKENTQEHTVRKKLFIEKDTSSTAQSVLEDDENDLSQAPKLTNVQSSPGIKEILTGLDNLNVSGNNSTTLKGAATSKLLTANIGASTEQSEDETPVRAITLRPYQNELARAALNGTNTVVCAPTGSGKTYVSTKIMLEHLKQPGVRKIVFFANQVALVNQQFRVIKDYMPRDYRIRELSGDTEEALRVPLRELLSRNDILVMTPQILVDALRDKEVSSLSEFTLLVFDECHHTNSRHPYNRIMFSYMDRKLDDTLEEDRKHLPQIVGLTASVGVGKAKNISGAVEHIRKLCANLDAGGGVSTVREFEEDLAKHARTVGMDVKKTERRTQDIFKNLVSDTLMGNIERMLLTPDYVGMVARPRFSDCLKPPVERGGDQYTIWVSTLKREVAHIEDQQVRRYYFSCRRMLELYNKSLAINEDCRTKDAILYLERELEKLYSSGMVMDETDRELKEQFERMKQRLLDASKNPLCTNPKLTSLAEMILGAFSKQGESRCMVFVKTRDLAMALKQWMLEDPNLSHLKPGIFTGQQASSDRGGMTRNQQLDAAELFRKGSHKVIIATSVAEEGMDFSQCNLVIRYEYVTNEIAMVQAKGRARAQDSQFVVLTGNQRGTAEKEELNLIREMMMNRALVQLQNEIQENPEKFRADLLSIQKAAKAERDHEARDRKGRILSDDEFEIRCMKCNELCCFSTDIRTVKATNHIVLDPDLESKIKATPHPRPCKMGIEMEKTKKIACKKCGLDWGIGVIYKSMVFAVIKIESFVAVDMMGRRDSPRKWKNAPFLVREITDDEFGDYKSLDI